MTAVNIAGSSTPNTSASVTANYTVTTLAGNTTAYGYQDGTGSDALFTVPTGVAIDASNNITVSDNSTFHIRKVTNPEGVVTTIAGDGYRLNYVGRWRDGIGTSASFKAPYGVVIDNNGDIIVADESRIRKINKNTIEVSTLAGDGNLSIFAPNGVAIDGNGDIIVADDNNNCIRKVTNPGGVITTIAGNGTPTFANGFGTNASFRTPQDVIVDLNGDIIVADQNNHRIRKINITTQEVTTLAGSGSAAFADGTGTGASFNRPSALAMYANGDIIVCDNYNNRIRKVTNPGGVVTTIAGTGIYGFNGDGIANDTQIGTSYAIAVDNNNDVIFTDGTAWGTPGGGGRIIRRLS